MQGFNIFQKRLLLLPSQSNISTEAWTMKAVTAILIYALSLFLQPLDAAVAHDSFLVVAAPRTVSLLLTKALEKLTTRKCFTIPDTNELSYEEWVDTLQMAKQRHGFVQIAAYPTPHQIKSLKKLEYRVLFLMRDPRDQAISLLFFLDEQKEMSFGTLGADNEPYASLPFDEKLHEIITGDRTGFCALKEIFDAYYPWTTQEKHFVQTVRFEDLVGKDSGGSPQQQLRTVKKIANFLRMKISDQEIQSRLQGFDRDLTFEKIGQWRHYFKLIHFHEMQTRYGSEMSKLGYTNHIKENHDEEQEAKRLEKKKKKESEIVVPVPR
jgi:hypothetical protein